MSAILLILFAGMLNGSFAVPTKYITKWQFEHIWLNFSLWGFVILPCLTMLYLVPQLFQIYTKIPINLLLIIIFGGLIYGIGQICFACALDKIGIGLGFVINLGIGTILGFAIPLIILYPHKIFTQFGLVTLAGIIMIALGLIVSNKAGTLRDHYTPKPKIIIRKNYFLGVLFATIAGISSASQNFIFSYTHSIQDLAIQAGASHFASANILWPGYLLCGFVPYMLYMLYLHYKNKSFGAYCQRGTSKYYLFSIIMGPFTSGSLFCYAKASHLIGALGPVIGWPMFMGVIIISSNFWGLKFGEWKNCGEIAKNTMILGLKLFIVAVIVLGYGSTQT